ncbi:MAG: thiamine pyrophosphate-dependent enzyme [Acidimicrobiales bacterium]
MLVDCRTAGEPVSVDFVAHAKAMGAQGEMVTSISGLEAALKRARSSERTYLIEMKVDPDSWTGGGAFWEVAVPEVSDRPAVNEARIVADRGRARQRIGW